MVGRLDLIPNQEKIVESMTSHLLRMAVSLLFFTYNLHFYHLIRCNDLHIAILELLFQKDATINEVGHHAESNKITLKMQRSLEGFDHF